MTLTAQQDMVIGALCSDEQFRRDIFACTTRQAVAARLDAYAASSQVSLASSLVDNVWALVSAPERTDLFSGFDGRSLLGFCKVWPCRSVTVDPEARAQG